MPSRGRSVLAGRRACRAPSSTAMKQSAGGATLICTTLPATGMFLTRSPLLECALAALEREAETNPNAARLLSELEELCPMCWSWEALETLNHFCCEGPIRSRPALMAVLLKELSAAFPVPRSLLQ